VHTPGRAVALVAARSLPARGTGARAVGGAKPPRPSTRGIDAQRGGLVAPLAGPGVCAHAHAACARAVRAALDRACQAVACFAHPAGPALAVAIGQAVAMRAAVARTRGDRAIEGEPAVVALAHVVFARAVA